ncbi:sodium bicarbonate cotransporter 3 [Hyalella azteca]|uniref:Anion exchange protein n=1 Tax=Hyalella azteca TaxID=294128 RepID=A0A979FU00_HYAAZ|nr:sodium bicarbonate cotransporter 3 [Hyalella azteca]
MSRKDERSLLGEDAGDEGSRDPGITAHHTSSADDYEGHRAHSVYVGYQLPSSMQHKKRSRHRHHRHHRHHQQNNKPNDGPMEDPSTRVQFILGEEQDDGSSHAVHPIFSEMETLVTVDGQYEWKETARWVKFEEDVEEGGERWSKPHVATLSLHALFELRSFLMKGVVLLDMDAISIEQVAELAIEALVNKKQLEPENKELLKDVIMRRHKHLYERSTKEGGKSMSNLPLIRSLAEIGRNHSSSKRFFKSMSFAGTQPPQGSAGTDTGLDTSPSTGSINRNQSGERLDKAATASQVNLNKGNTNFMRKIPPGSEASNILVGEVNFLKRPFAVFIRLSEAAFMGNLTEVPVPTRFIFIHMGPQGGLSHFHENGRAMATLFSDEIFHEVAYKAQKNEHLLAGVDEFLDAVTVLPPGEWDPSIRIEPPALIPSQEQRKKPQKVLVVDEEEEERKMREASGLVRTGRLFGGFINDVKRKAPWYWSDFRDGISMQSVATFFFLYFACLAPIITFGGLLGEATGNRIAAMESLVSGLVCGVVYGLFSGQPLTILGSTGPVLVFESIMYDFCTRAEWDYLSFRLWVGLWCGAILILLVAIDASAMVCYITRFTEENFATLIAFIFIYKAVEKVALIGSKYPMETHVDWEKPCVCDAGEEWNGTVNDWNITSDDCVQSFNGTMVGPGCAHYYPDVFLLSVLLFLGTFLISCTLKDFKGASFFPTKKGGGYPLDLFCVAVRYSSYSLCPQKGGGYPLDLFCVAVRYSSYSLCPQKGGGYPLDLFCVAVRYSSYSLCPQKGGGYPLDLFCVAVRYSSYSLCPQKGGGYPLDLFCVAVRYSSYSLCPQKGGGYHLDLFCVAVRYSSYSLCPQKGGGYHLDLFCVAVLIMINSIMGLPWFVAATVLSINHVNSLKQESECAAPGEKPQFLGVQENRVPLKKVHLFTLIQLVCLVVLWVIKSFSQTSILFPIMGMMTIPLANGNVMRVPVNINISEEMNNSGIWKGMDHGDGHGDHASSARNRGTKKDAQTAEERRRLSVMPEDEEGETEGITIKVIQP